MYIPENEEWTWMKKSTFFEYAFKFFDEKSWFENFFREWNEVENHNKKKLFYRTARAFLLSIHIF